MFRETIVFSGREAVSDHDIRHQQHNETCSTIVDIILAGTAR